MNVIKKKLASLLVAAVGLTASLASSAPICDKKINTTCSSFHTPVKCTIGSAVGVHSCFRRSNNIDYEVRAKTTGTATYAATVLLEPTGVQAGNCVIKAEGKNASAGDQCRARYTNSVAAMQMYAY